MERFLGVLMEHYGGAFPLWLAPVQALVIPIADRHLEYATQIKDTLRAQGFRVEIDSRGERMNHKIRDAQLQKVPYMLIVGDGEVNQNTVSVRPRNEDNLGPMSMSSLLEMLDMDMGPTK